MSEDLIKERLNNHEKRIETLENSTSDIKTVVYRLDTMDKRLDTMEGKLDLALKKDTEEKGKKWDKFIEYIFYAVVGILIAYIAYKLGFKN